MDFSGLYFKIWNQNEIRSFIKKPDKKIYLVESFFIQPSGNIVERHRDIKVKIRDCEGLHLK